MKTCTYCGSESSQNTMSCHGCGQSEFKSCEEEPIQEAASQECPHCRFDFGRPKKSGQICPRCRMGSPTKGTFLKHLLLAGCGALLGALCAGFVGPYLLGSGPGDLHVSAGAITGALMGTLPRLIMPKQGS